MGMTYPQIRPAGYETKYRDILPKVIEEQPKQLPFKAPKTTAGLLLGTARELKPRVIAAERTAKALTVEEQARQEEQEMTGLAQTRLIKEEAAQWASQEAARRGRRGRYETIITGELVPQTRKKMLLGG